MCVLGVDGWPVLALGLVLIIEQLVVATQFLQGCIEVFDLEDDSSYIECLPVPAKQVTDVVCDDWNDFIFAFSSNGVMCLHAVRCIEHDTECTWSERNVQWHTLTPWCSI